MRVTSLALRSSIVIAASARFTRGTNDTERRTVASHGKSSRTTQRHADGIIGNELGNEFGTEAPKRRRALDVLQVDFARTLRQKLSPFPTVRGPMLLGVRQHLLDGPAEIDGILNGPKCCQHSTPRPRTSKVEH
jgi:hypothetical protein